MSSYTYFRDFVSVPIMFNVYRQEVRKNGFQKLSYHVNRIRQLKKYFSKIIECEPYVYEEQKKNVIEKVKNVVKPLRQNLLTELRMLTGQREMLSMRKH